MVLEPGRGEIGTGLSRRHFLGENAIKGVSRNAVMTLHPAVSAGTRVIKGIVTKSLYCCQL